MARNRNRRSKLSSDDDDPEDTNDMSNTEWELPETHLRATGLLDDILRSTARSDPRLPQLLLLRHQLETDEGQLDEARTAIEQFEQAYAQLTSPANRIGVYLGTADGAEGVEIALGDQEFIATIDPKLESDTLRVGTRVRVNDAYSVVGDLGYHPGGMVAKVTEVVGDTLLKVGADPQGTSSRYVHRSSDLLSQTVKVGDDVRIEPNHKVALERFAAAENQEYFLESVPEIPWESIGGQEEVIEVIKDAIEMPLLYPELYARFEKRPLKGVLLYGPPGCGKTLIGKATAYNLTREYRERTKRDVREYFMFISGPKILNMWLGETERMVREIFRTAREKAAEGHLVFLFVDEAESLLRTRSSGRFLNISNTVVPQFCAEMDGLVGLENVVVILTSNRPDYIDPALLRPERIDRKVKVGRPNRKACRDILSIYLAPHLPLDAALVREHKGDSAAARDEVIDLAIEHLWRKDDDTQFLEVHLMNGSVQTLYWRDLVSGALIKSVVERAKDFAIKRSIQHKSDAEGITLDDLKKAMRVEFKENEIFPKSETQDDWLKLLDYEPDNVATIKPVAGKKAVPAARRNVI